MGKRIVGQLRESLGWRGVLEGGTAALRRVTAAVLALACITYAVTQWGFVGIMFEDGGSAYLVFMLMPVVIAAMLLGTVAGAGTGLFSGSVLYLHAVAMPLDYYELTYVTALTSIVAMTIVGLVLGLLFSLVVRKVRSRRLQMLFVVLACLVVSWIFSASFIAGAVGKIVETQVAEHGGSVGLAELAKMQLKALSTAQFSGNSTFQALGDALFMSVAALLALRAGERGMTLAGELGLRAVFGVRLSAAVLAAFMLVASTGYVAITVKEFNDSQRTMLSEAEYLLGQVERADSYNVEVLQTLIDAAGDDEEAAERAFELFVDGGIGIVTSLVDGYEEGVDGVVVVAMGDIIATTNAERLEGSEYLLSGAFDSDILEAVERSVEGGTLERVVYLAPSSANDLIDFSVPTVVGGADFDDVYNDQVGYLMAARGEEYLVVFIRPSSLIFAGRDDVMGWVTLTSIVLLLSVFALAWYLLDRLVARQVDATNSTLERITEGELDARVVPASTKEFWDLSAGINVTVDALQGWIAEAESRMDAELATAKAIQESALPGVFPPYPDILRFDIFASMNAAKEVGGDFYDFFLIGDDATPTAGKLAFVMADVSGKGVPAALFMMKAKTQIQDYLASGMELGEAAENANHQLCEGNDAGMFVTAWVGVLDYGSFHVEYVNAGHNPPLIWQDGHWDWVRERSGLPLGLFDGMPYRTHSIDCMVGDQLLLYTDGVTEAFSVEEEQYGEERLEQLVNDSRDLHPRELVERVRYGVAQHAEGAEQSDDITILALEVGVPPEEKIELVVPAVLDELSTVNDFIHTELDRRLAPVRAQGQLDIAVEELFVNVCNYAYEGVDPDIERTVRVTCAFSADPPSVTVELIDGGVFWDPLAKPDAKRAGEYDSMADVPIGGLGILMAKRNVDEMRYERAGESNVVTLVKCW